MKVPGFLLCLTPLLPPLLPLGACIAPRGADLPSPAALEAAREHMVELALRQAGIEDPAVLNSMRTTERHEFVPVELWPRAYDDAGLPIGDGQTISSPFIVACMTEALEPKRTDRVLEIGTGSGYQAAVLSPLVQDVYSIEIVEPLGRRAAATLARLGYRNVHTKVGDGYLGWEEHAPFDKIIVTCSPESVPEPLVAQLAEGGMLVVPVGERYQQVLYRMTKENGELVRSPLRPTLFVPMSGEAEARRRVLPDGARPALVNGDFEAGLDDSGNLRGWYYQRRLAWRETVRGNHHVEFTNDAPGQHAHVMQGFALDGRAVERIDFSARMATVDARSGARPEEVPQAALTFYDDEHRPLGTLTLGPLVGTNEWRVLTERGARVPRAARKAIVRIGLFGATGTASFDAVEVSTSEPDGQAAVR